MRRRTAPAAAALLATLVLALGGCSSDSSGSGAGHDDADVEFAAEMVPHHEQALRMVAMTRGRDVSPDFRRLTRQIRAAQAPEIRTMQGWLDDWGFQSDDGITGHMHGDDQMMGGDWNGSMMGGAGGRLSMHGRDWHRLGGAPGRTFEDMWLRMMIRHHRGAIAMSRDEVAHGEFPDAIALARHIEESQQAEIDQMRRMLAG
ncbi:DUF305 domain-containing protein [Nocardioides sp. MAHUQ-72]|uniref:DUF305 domain-containing protein n=1 Tax=unclassified Nocardioides TaxID=2615069 RepID=UPI00360A3133